jgi:DNA invertase Pin-like site-specific DNA recombinase
MATLPHSWTLRLPQRAPSLRRARGRKTSLTLILTPEERQTLLAWQRSTTIPAGRAKRARIILLLADGMPIVHIAQTVGISRRFVYKWIQRFLQEGVEGLADRPTHGSRHGTSRSPVTQSDEDKAGGTSNVEKNG